METNHLNPLRPLMKLQEALQPSLPGSASLEDAERLSELRSFFEQDIWKGLCLRATEERRTLIERCLIALSKDERASAYVAGQAEGMRMVIETLPLRMLEDAVRSKMSALEEQPEPEDRY